MHINFEFKARCSDIDRAEEKLLLSNPVFKGIDHQVDTYFNVPFGRLKLREGNIENALNHYDGSDAESAKQSDVTLYDHRPYASLKEILTRAIGIKIVIDKR